MQIINVMAASLDGRIASRAGETDEERRGLGFTHDEDRRHLLGLINTADAVIVGRSSIEASGGAFPGKNAKGVHPIWAVMTNRGLSAQSPILRQGDLPRWLVSAKLLADVPPQPTLRNVVVGAEAPAKGLVEALKEAGAERVLLFGGAQINQLFYKEGLVDELILTLCPMILGTASALPLVAPALPRPVKLSLLTSHPHGNLVFLTYKVHKL